MSKNKYNVSVWGSLFLTLADAPTEQDAERIAREDVAECGVNFTDFEVQPWDDEDDEDGFAWKVGIGGFVTVNATSAEDAEDHAHDFVRGGALRTTDYDCEAQGVLVNGEWQDITEEDN